MKNFKNLALGLTFSAGLVASSSALANGMTAGCCDKVADLEARVDRLDAKAVEGTTKKIILSGWVNRLVAWADNGVNSNVYHADSGNGVSNLSALGTVDLNADWTIGAEVKVEYSPNSTLLNDVHAAQDTLSAGQRIRVHSAYVMAQSKTFGTLKLGRQPSANDSSARNIELATGGAALASEQNFMGGLRFTNTFNGARFDLPIAYLLEEGDGTNVANLQDSIRYQSPKFFKVISFDASHAYHNRGDIFEIAAKFAAQFKGVTVLANAFWGKDSSQDPLLYFGLKQESYGGSAGIILPFSYSGKDLDGPNALVALSRREFNLPAARNGRYFKVKVGHKDHFTSLGFTALHVSFAKATDMIVVPQLDANQNPIGYLPMLRPEVKVYGISLTQEIEKAGTYVYAGYRHAKFTLGNSGVNYNSMDWVGVGCLVRF